ncbi:MAG: 3-deoxy-manno-octulosonate cytidylyltransferase, partial [Flavobacteriaceae bacterium]|nr:3-deoxy-manno-octulosonate cytidylyltransferase [Flavobacteriaceae bacterium]
MSRVICLIPARLESFRFPNKLIKLLGDKTLIERTYLNVVKSGLFDQVAVVTDNQQIGDIIKKARGEVILQKQHFQCGTDRIAAVCSKFDGDIIFNIQGDEPFLPKDSIVRMIDEFSKDVKGDIDIVSSMVPINNSEDIANPNNVKVVTNLKNEALYFSRSVIPYRRELQHSFQCYKHQGVYGFRKETLREVSQQNPTPLEIQEKIEAIRFLEMGKTIRMVVNTIE